MIITNLHDGLGNQLFTLFTVLATAIKQKKNYNIINTKQNGYRNLYFNNFFTSIKTMSIEELKNIKNIKSYQEPSFHYQPIPKMRQPLFIKGFFQSYKYFKKEYPKIMKKYFKVPDDINNKISNLFNKIQTQFPEHLIYSLHIRWGDYQTFHYNHPILPEEYYLKTINKINQEDNKNKIFLIFCDPDDTIRIKEKFKQINKYPTFYLSDIIPEKLLDYEELWLMSKCHHHIIANSSFSWWGAYFNEKKDKKVYYPSLWFGDNLIINKKYQLKDLHPKDWIKVELL